MLFRCVLKQFSFQVSKISSRLQQFSGRPSELSRKKRPKSWTLTSRSHLFILFWHTATVALHSGTWFSTVRHIIPASQVLSKNPTAGFGRGFLERVSSEHPPLPFEISHNAIKQNVIVSRYLRAYKAPKQSQYCLAPGSWVYQSLSEFTPGSTHLVSCRGGVLTRLFCRGGCAYLLSLVYPRC